MKNLFFVLIAVLTATIYSSCKNVSEYPVTVLSQDITSFSGKFNKAMAGEYPYLAVTESGDTVQVLVDEELLLKNKRPFKAVMTKDSNSRFGMVHAN